MIYDILIIGAGPAGLTAGIYAKRANLNVLVFEKYIPGGQIVNTNEVENYPGFEKLSGYELADKMLNHFNAIGAELKYEEVLQIIDLGKIKKVITNKQEYETKTVIIATGTEPRKLDVENEEQLSGRGISWCAICDGPMYKEKEVVVVGGGNSAVEEAIYLSSLASKVTVIQNLEDLTADKKAQDNLKSKENVEFKFNSQVNKFLVDEKGELIGVEISNKDKKIEVIKADGVFEYIGLIPITSFLKNLNITNEYGYVIANEKMETKIKGIYAAGDSNFKQIRQIVTATADGAIAVQNALKYLENN